MKGPKILFLIILLSGVIFVVFSSFNNTSSFISRIINLFQKGYPLSLNIEINPSNDSSFSEEKVLEDSKIESFYLSKNSNFLFLVYKDKISLFDRKKSQKTNIYETKNSFEEIILPPFKDIKDIIIKTPKEYSLVFLIPSIQQELSLNNSFLKSLKNSDLKDLERNPKVLKIIYHPFLENVYLIKTKEALYFYDFKNNQVELIYFGPTSDIFINNNLIYFVKENGVISVYSLKEKKEIKTSFYSFYNQNYLSLKIFFNEKQNFNDFIVVDENENAYYFKNIETPSPTLIDKDIKAVFLNGEEIIYLTINKENKEFLIKKFSPGKQKTLFLTSTEQPVLSLLNNNTLAFIKNQKLYLFDLIKNEEIPLSQEKVKNNNFSYDPALSYLYYLTEEGIYRIILK